MATKFSSVYKQELKNKGILSSMGSAVLKSAKERLDVRNVLFGGKGMMSATGQKAFGRGYSALSSGAGAVIAVQNPAQTAATNELLSSSERQEALLRVVAKNTFNMNMMARDTNITRQNIVTLTKKMTGSAARSQDALWYDVRTRNIAIDELAGKKETSPTKTAETKAPTGRGMFSGIANAIGSVIGALGGIGGGILSALSIVARLSPILAIIGIMASAYVVKELAKAVDFNAIKKSIAKVLGIDTESEKSILQQWVDKLDDKFDTTFFNDSKKNVESFFKNTTEYIREKFGPQIETVSEGIINIIDISMAYTRAAFRTLADGFSGIGKAVGFLFSEFFESNRGKLLGILGGGIAAGIAGRFVPPTVAAAIGAAVGSAVGFVAQGPKSRGELQEDIAVQEKSIAELDRRLLIASEDIQKTRPGTLERAEAESRFKEYQRKRETVGTVLEDLKSKYGEAQTEFMGYLTPDSTRFGTYLGEEMQKVDANRAAREQKRGKPYSGSSDQGTAPTQVSKSLSSIRWRDLSEEQKNALLNEQARQEGYVPGKLPFKLNNPGAIIWAPPDTDWQKQFGGKPGTTVTDAYGKTRTFTQFPDAESGKAAQRWLWDNGKPRGTPGYANMSLFDAFKKWVAPETEGASGFQNYIGNVLKQIRGVSGAQISDASSGLSNATRMSMMPDGQGTTVVAPQNTTVVAGGSSGGSIPSPYNIDLLDAYMDRVLG